MDEPREFKIVSVVFEPSDIDRLDRISRRIAEVLGTKRPNRSDALRRMIDEFDVEAWARRNVPQHEAA